MRTNSYSRVVLKLDSNPLWVYVVTMRTSIRHPTPFGHGPFSDMRIWNWPSPCTPGSHTLSLHTIPWLGVGAIWLSTPSPRRHAVVPYHGMRFLPWDLVPLSIPAPSFPIVRCDAMMRIWFPSPIPVPSFPIMGCNWMIGIWFPAPFPRVVPYHRMRFHGKDR